jgi:eukaryotic-like serine/threonine-protein kinase
MNRQIMDPIKAKELEARLKGRKVGDWTVDALIDHGKSAAVFRASGPHGNVAVKIFDDELIARYGDDTQFARIERERYLVAHHHANLVEIMGGGFDESTQNHYVVMGLLDGPNLKQCLQHVPVENISTLVSQLASAAQFLEGLGYCHRDIKPENIILLDDDKRLVLLDLGVIRPVAGSDLTDGSGVQAFVGTLQYSSPEFLLRQEEDSIEGWRALTFYQIGAVLHDLIMRRPLFTEFAEPYSRLVNAVQHAIPEIQNTVVSRRLVDLARCCLIKNWRTRLRLVDWKSFEEPKTVGTEIASAKQRVTNRGMFAEARRLEQVAASAGKERTEIKRLLRETLDFLGASARAIRAGNRTLPPITVLEKTPDERGIAVQFASAAAYSWPLDLTVLLSAEVIDVDARAISIDACACLGPFKPADSVAITRASIFKGTLDVQHSMNRLKDASTT